MISFGSPNRTTRPVRSLAAFATRLRRDSRGNVAMMFAILLVPIAMLVLGSIDFYRASKLRGNLQDSLDSAALAAARTPSTDPAAIAAAGDAALRANLPGSDFSGLQSSFRLVGGRVVAEARLTIDPWVSGFMFPDGLTTSATSEVVRGATRLEIAMVLDVTGSMNEASGGVSKLERLRDAGVAMVDILEASAEQSGDPNSVKISVVPFGQTVRVGAGFRTSTYTAPWLVNNTSHAVGNAMFNYRNNTNQTVTQQVNRFAMFDRLGRSWAGCVESRPQPYDVQDTAPVATVPNTYFIPYFAPDEPDGPSTNSPNNPNGNRNFYHNGGRYELPVDNNYIKDRLTDGGSTPTHSYQSGENRFQMAQNNTAKYLNRDWHSNIGSRGPNYGCELSPLRRLTTNYNDVRSTIRNLNASGNTNIPIGMVWGWHTISPNAPFADGTAYGTQDVTKVVVLMTDGNNVNDQYYNWNDSRYSGVAYIKQNRLGITGGDGAARTAAMDSRLALLCSNMRAQNIVVYTVRVEVTEGSSNVLRNCATSEENFYDVENAAQLTDAFEAIAGSITRLRIAH